MTKKTSTLALSAALLIGGCSQQQPDLAAAKMRIQELEGQLAAEKAKNEQLEKKVASAPVTPPAPSPEPKAASSEPTPTARAPEPAKEEPTGLQWRYDVDEDKMTGSKSYHAGVTSTNSVSFDFPYSGAQHGTLQLRTHPRYGKDVIFSIERGQILCSSYDGCSVKVRFDDEKPMTFSANAPADHSTEYVFLDGYDRFVGKLQKAKTVRIAVSIYQQGSPVFEFDVSGFDPAQYKPKKK